MIRKATLKDINTIMKIVDKVIILMQEYGNDQWSSNYPNYSDFHSDISSGHLFVDCDDKGQITSFACFNQNQDIEYSRVNWKIDKPALIIHRLAVSPDHHGQGLAKKLFSFAEKLAIELDINYLRSDTCCCNDGMNAIFKKFGYSFSGITRFPGSKFNYNCYEKELIR